MVDENYHSTYKYKKNAYLSSVLIGIINGALLPGEDEVTFVSFERPCYKENFYEWGKRIAKSKKK